MGQQTVPAGLHLPEHTGTVMPTGLPNGQGATRIVAYVPPLAASLTARLPLDSTEAERHAVALVERNRPVALRAFDQIPMHNAELLQQVQLVTPSLAGQTVAFIGDYDSASLVLGVLGNHGYQRPSRMVLLDFDERLLAAAQTLAEQQGFAGIFDVRRYNVFDRVPRDLAGQFDWFYTNPPYGCRNDGASGRLFIARGCELTQAAGHGYAILPCDAERPWTQRAMLATQQFLTGHGWLINEMVPRLHTYALDDDPKLSSSLIHIERVAGGASARMPYVGRSVACAEIPHFYGRTVFPPYPHYIRPSGEPDTAWDAQEVA